MFLCIPHLCFFSPYFVFTHSVLRSADISIHFTVTPLNLLLLYIYADSDSKAFIFCQRFQKLPFFLFQHRNVVLKKYYFILSYLKKYLHRKKAAHMCCQIMPFVGLTPFLQVKGRQEHVERYVSMPFIGLTPFLRYPLGTRIKWGHNSDTITGNCPTIYFFAFFSPFFPSFAFQGTFSEKEYINSIL